MTYAVFPLLSIDEARQAELKAEREEKLAKAKVMIEAIVAEFQEIRTKAESVDYEAGNPLTLHAGLAIALARAQHVV